MLIRSGLVGMAVLGMVLAMTPGVVQSQGRAGGPAPSPAGRFVDNGDETITDTQLGLMWEKKTSAVGSGTSSTDIRDVDNTYTWEYAMNEWIDRLNGRLIAFANDGAFARHSDWRLPTMQELQYDRGAAGPGADQRDLRSERPRQLLDRVATTVRSDVRLDGRAMVRDLRR